MLTTFIVISLLPGQGSAPIHSKSWVEFDRLCVVQRKALVEAFATDGFWKRSPQELAPYFEAAVMLQPVEILPALIEHIDYYDEKRVQERWDQPSEEYRPVFRVMLSYRSLAVPAVLNYLATHDKTGDPPLDGRYGVDIRLELCKCWLLTLDSDIRETHGYPRIRERARELITTEQQRRHGKEAERLKKLLDTQFAPPAK